MALIKPEIERCRKLFDDGFSLITVSENKIPNIKWKEYQTTAMHKDTFENFYALETTAGVGLVTGYGDLEVLDFDLKVLSTNAERSQFWKEFISMANDNIEDFENKFVIVKTRNYGYHILYKTKQVLGNTKIARLKGSQEAIIESRGRGGYVWIYDQFVQLNNYADIQYIADDDREILWTICKMYNYVEPEKDQPEQQTMDYHEADIKIWDDFNSRNRIIDMIASEFTIVKRLSDKTVVRRNGAKSPHSGYIYHDKNFLFLWSSGTQYPQQKALTAFNIYAIQRHNGDIKATCKDLYNQGYGSRMKPEYQIKPQNYEQPVVDVEDSKFPIEVFPDFVQLYIKETADTLNSNIDYLGSGFLWAISLCTGNAVKLEVKKGWVEPGIVWIALVGRAGVGKTHSIKAITKPLEKLNTREVKRYAEQLERYEKYMELSHKEKSEVEEIKRPKKTKFIAEDITMEALSELHDANPNGIGILRDELVGWIRDMNKYREGSDLQKYLTCWSNGTLSSDRKTSSSSYVEKAYIPIIGGVQPSVLAAAYTAENKDNGFVDRILICYPEIKVEPFNDRQINESLINQYDEFMTWFYDNMKNRMLKYDNNGNVATRYLKYSPEAYKEFERIFNKYTDRQNSDEENEYVKSVLPKMKSYVARISLLLEVLYMYTDNYELGDVSKRAVVNAEKITDYFIYMAKKNKYQSQEHQVITSTIKYSGKINAFDKFKALYEANPNLNKTRVAEELAVSRQTVINWENKMKSVK
ncbi:MAG: DUF3987 domain-containing protein [Paludibacteraceae bacterium]